MRHGCGEKIQNIHREDIKDVSWHVNQYVQHSKKLATQFISANSRQLENFVRFYKENYGESTLPVSLAEIFGVAAVLFIAEEVAMRSKSSSTHQYCKQIHTKLVSHRILKIISR